MEDKNHIDELFRTGLNQNFPVDDNLWAQVESQLPAQASRKGLWVFNLNSLAIMAILSISMVLKTDTAETKQVAVQNIVDSEFTEEQFVEYNEAKIIPTQNLESTSKPESKIDNAKPNNRKSKNETTLITETKSESTPLIKNEPIVKDHALVAENNVENLESNTELSIDSKKPLILGSVLENDIPQAKEKTFNTQFEKEEPNEMKPIIFGDLDYLEPSGFQAINTSLIQEPINKKNFWTATRKPYYYYEIEANKSLNVEKQVSGLSPELESYKTERESGGSNVNFGLNVLTDYKYLQFGIGIRFIRYTESLAYTIDANGIGYDISFDTTYSVVNGNFNSNGEPVLLIRREIERIETEKGIIVKQNLFFRNEFERLQVPLLVGIHKNYGRFYGNLRASILLNYSVQQTGAYIGNDLNSINNFEASKQINQFVIGNGYAASLGFSLNEFVVVGTRFNYETDLTSFTKDYSSRFSQYGLGLWLMWKPR